jgi:type 1 glutamine amidotransferase
MTRPIHSIPIRFLLATTLMAGVNPVLFAAGKPMPTDEEVKKIASAVPAKATATPATPRKLLVFTLCKGFYHTSIPWGAKAVELMGQKTGAFQATVTDDIAFFEPEKLSQFDGVCLMSALGEYFLPDNLKQLPAAEQAAARKNDERLKKNFADYIRSGKGLAAIHGASYSFPEWPEFAVMLGGFFDSHPWNGTERLAVKIDEPQHPLNAAFGNCGFEIIDEGYQFKEPYSRAKVRVLMSLDTRRMDMNKKNLRPDQDFGLAWVKRYGQGRVFYNALGHNPEEFWNPALLQHLLDGIQFTLGELEAPTEVR